MDKKAKPSAKRKRNRLSISLRMMLFLFTIISLLAATIIGPAISRSNSLKELRKQNVSLQIESADQSWLQRYIRHFNADAVDRVLAVEGTRKIGVSLNRLNPLSSFRELQKIDLEVLESGNTSALSNLVNLTHLVIRKSDIQQSRHLLKLVNLKRLQLSRSKLQEVEGLREMKELEILSIHRTKVQSLAPLANLSKLYSLNIKRCPVNDLSPLAQLPNLQHLNASQTQLAAVIGLEGATELRTIDIRRTTVTDLSPLDNLQHLKWVYLNGCPIETAEIERFKKLHPECDIKH